MKIAVYPGSFDPITNGHLAVLKRSLEVFDRVILLVAVNPRKAGNFPLEERIRIIKEATRGLPGVVVDSYDGLTVDYCRLHGAKHLIRGLRAVTDFEYEFQLAAANEFADPSIDMVFFMAKPEDSFVSSSTIHELYLNGVDVSSLVPPAVLSAYREFYPKPPRRPIVKSLKVKK